MLYLILYNPSIKCPLGKNKLSLYGGGSIMLLGQFLSVWSNLSVYRKLLNISEYEANMIVWKNKGGSQIPGGEQPTVHS